MEGKAVRHNHGALALAAALAALLALALLPARALAAELVASGTCGTCPWELDSEGTLTIGAGELANPEDNWFLWPWYDFRKQVTSVVTLGKIRCGNSLRNCFVRFNSLSSIDLSGWDTSSVTDMGSMFSGCSSLSSLDLSGWDTSSVTDMGQMFWSCSSLASLDTSGWDTSSVTDMRFMFYNCSSLKALDLSNWNTSSVTSMLNMFFGCSSLVDLDVSGWDTSSVTDMGSMFHSCSSLASLDLTGWDTSSVADMGYMFSDCSSLKSLDLSDFDTTLIEEMSCVFQGCSSLASLDLSGWDTSSVTGMGSMFEGCASLASLDLSGWDTSSVTGMGAMFSGCSSLKNITVSAKYQIKCADMFPDATSEQGWWSLSDRAWYSKEEICANRSGMADVYLNQESSEPRDITLCEVTLSELSYVYDGTAKVPSVTVKAGSTILVDETDYELSFTNNVDAGTASVTVTGIGDCEGTKTATFEIAPADVAGATVAAIPDQAWTGSAVTPSPEVALGGRVLADGTDYELSYEDNVDAGTATVTVEGKGNYTGAKTATFKIAKVAPEWRRLAGDGRYDTMAEIVSEGWSGQTGGTVVVATGEGFKDALAAAGLAGLDGGPVVLTAGKSLSRQAEAQLRALRPSKVYVAGGTFAVSDGVLSAIQRATGVKPVRVAGKTSASTSAELALAGKGRWDGTAIIATNKSFKDALSVAPVSYAKHWPILLADNGKSLNADVIAALKACGIRRAYIVGGKLAVTANVESQLKKAGIELADRLSGANGPATSRAIADFALGNGLTVANMAFATSQNFPDALAGAALCGKNGSVLLLCDDKAQANLSFATDHASQIECGYVFGGEMAFSKGLFDRLPR